MWQTERNYRLGTRKRGESVQPENSKLYRPSPVAMCCINAWNFTMSTPNITFVTVPECTVGMQVMWRERIPSWVRGNRQVDQNPPVRASFSARTSHPCLEVGLSCARRHIHVQSGLCVSSDQTGAQLNRVRNGA